MVDISFQSKFNRLISLDELKQDDNLTDMMVIKKGVRLSIQPVSEQDFNYILRTYTE